MKRKILILTFTIIFSLSTTALPIAIHYCSMLEKASFEKCEMHNISNENSCCMEDNDFELFYAKQIDECCSDYIVDESIKDEFVSSKVDLNEKIQISIIIVLNNELTTSFKPELFIRLNSSPPPLFSSHIFLLNSVLLI